jgi:iron complex outermembrane receptor protein
LCDCRASPPMVFPAGFPARPRVPILRIGRLVVVALWLAGGFSADAAEGRRKSYALPADEASRSLNQFATQSGEQVIFLLNQVRGVRTNPVNGNFTAREAIERLVADTALRVIADPQTGAFMIQRAAASKEEAAPARPPGPGR